MDRDAIRREIELVRADWSARGRHWDRRSDELAEQAARMNEPLIEAAGIEPGQQVCDIATGAGEPALSVASLVGAEGRVFATDLCPEMMLGARRRAAAQGLGNITFRTADMLALPDADSAFDRVTCRFGLMFCPAPARAAAEALRVLKPGGRAAYLVWGPRADTTMFVVFVAAVEAVLGPLDELEEVDLARPFSLGAPGALERALTEGGLTNVEEREVRFAPRVPAEAPFWQAQFDMTFGRALDGASEATRHALLEAAAAGFERLREGDEIPLDVHVRIGVGAKPAG
ncbi:MAG: methyltransferase domain-containing protein [Rhodospirillales bacterium]|nr:methyltransferase domain-containing protein [Rhodospirillales bacterium]